MSTGMVFTSFVAFLVSASAFISGTYIFKEREKDNRSLAVFSLFLLATAGLWLFVGVELLFSWMGDKDFPVFFFTLNQVFVFCSGPILAYYLTYKIFGNKTAANIITIFYSLGACWGFFFLLKLGVTQGESTYFADKFRLNDPSFFIFASLIIPLVLAALFVFLYGASRALLKKNNASYDFFYSLIIFIYLFLGIFDEQGLIVGWPLVFFRLVFVSIFLLAYLIFYLDHSEKEELIIFDYDRGEK